MAHHVVPLEDLVQRDPVDKTAEADAHEQPADFGRQNSRGFNRHGSSVPA
jgi:hypothetical protein